MHVDVSMYLETAGRARIPDSVPCAAAEERRISRVCGVFVTTPSRFLESHEERLVLGRPRVRVHRRRGEEVRERSGVARASGRIAPVEREADVPDLLAVDRQV